MDKPVLVVLAAGMGSRYGGMKQLDPVGPSGQLIIDYSIFDARRAGFEKVIFIIRQEFEADFRKAIGDRLSRLMEAEYAYQSLDDLPAPYTAPEGRTKPFGTGQAVLSARNLIHGPFAVINSDDYYGPEAFRVMYEYLSTHADTQQYQYCMVGYQVKNTVTENGSVSRGVCVVGSDGMLESVTERTKIVQDKDGVIRYADGDSWVDLPGDTLVSMGIWGLTASFMQEAQDRFSGFLAESLPKDPMKCEYFLPTIISDLIGEGKAQVRMLHSTDKWYGVTYREDKPGVMAALARLTEEGLYPVQF
ncbi:sugar phosphate nucleotidyltransferase [Faecalibacterium sp. An122]|uniref:sugar phosphate nucleotidyltransferase n=1 Tax=Faecalibacterium sp. An122 TaxID=1965551 RepID=UPI000B36961F|nr:sugar phosphate nucleotidyltransferase [Faecalibacterium sp. An122]OUQ39438.1 nucleotidyltransferase [Faecalibacterium sp. An122]